MTGWGGSVGHEPEDACHEGTEQDEDETESRERGCKSTQHRIAGGDQIGGDCATEEQHADEAADEQRQSRVQVAGHVPTWVRLGGKGLGGRAQANLPALAIALLVLTTAGGLAFSLADGAFADATRDPTDRRLATGVAERLVAADSPLTVRAGVLDARSVSNLTAERFVDDVPSVSSADIRLRVADRTVFERGDPAGGATARRIVLVAEQQRVTRSLPPGENRTTLPRRTERVTLDVDPVATRVRTVRVNGRVVLHEPSGLDGAYTVRVSRYETATLTFETDGPLRAGSVTLTYVPYRTTKATLEVTVDA